MIDLFECCGEIASVGIIVDFTEDTETYHILSALLQILKLGHTMAVPENLRKELCGTATKLAILSRI